jgi:thioredoxin 2
MTATTNIVCPHCDTVNRIPAARLGDRPVCGKCKQSLFTGHPLVLKDGNFNQQLSRSDIPVVVDFWAPWCGPCKMMAPAYEQAAGQLEPRVRLAKLNTEEAQQTAGKFAIRSIPTIVLFDHGREVARQSGAMSLPQLVQWIEGQIK